MSRRLSRAHKTALYVGLPLAVVAAAAISARAFDVSWIQPNATLSASKLTANLQALAMGPIYCGKTDPTSGGGIQGYGGNIDKLCATAAGCTSTAHMCTAHEMIRTAQIKGATIGGNGAQLWYDTGIYASDCKGWTSSSMSDMGQTWFAGGPKEQNCSVIWPVACCDLPQ